MRARKHLITRQEANQSYTPNFQLMVIYYFFSQPWGDLLGTNLSCHLETNI